MFYVSEYRALAQTAGRGRSIKRKSVACMQFHAKVVVAEMAVVSALLVFLVQILLASARHRSKCKSVVGCMTYYTV